MPTPPTTPQIAYGPVARRLFPQLRSRALLVEGVDPALDPGRRIALLQARADARLARADEAVFPEIQAWRRAFSFMGLRPTQYRCAAEALLRRRRKEGALSAELAGAIGATGTGAVVTGVVPR